MARKKIAKQNLIKAKVKELENSVDYWFGQAAEARKANDELKKEHTHQLTLRLLEQENVILKSLNGYSRRLLERILFEEDGKDKEPGRILSPCGPKTYPDCT